ncbi:MAG: hypothetical protein HKN03_05675 [Acidimicrobiales bacterium]|nr:hypothetical protein [Acidimicrobiales bacterium]
MTSSHPSSTPLADARRPWGVSPVVSVLRAATGPPAIVGPSGAHDRPARSEVGERLRVLLVAGILTGVIVAGAGSRLAMLILRLTSPSSVHGRVSDDGFVIGRFTLGGTYSLLLLGAFVGVLGAAAYRAVAPWLLGPGWFRRVTVAASSGVVVGSMLVHDDGIDFHVLTPLWLAIGLFVLLPAAFGLAIAAAVDRVAAAPPDDRLHRWVVPIAAVAAFPAVLPIVGVALAVLIVWVPVRRFLTPHRTPKVIALTVRAVWLSIAVAGLIALVRDVQALT